MDPLVLVGAVAAVFAAAAAAQAITGFGCALVAAPLLVMLIGPPRAIAVTVAVSGAIAALGWWRERAHVVVPSALRLSVAGVVGMPIGLVVLTLVDERTLTILIAVVLLALVVALAARVTLPRGGSVEIGAGLVAGGLLTSTSMNGPPLVLALQGSDLSPVRFRATLQAVFTNQDAIALMALVALGHADLTSGIYVAVGLVAVPLGWRLGDRVFGLLSPAAFRGTVLAGLAVTALVALVGTM